MSTNKKPKLVRDSFTMPKQEYAAIETLKARALAAGVAVKKSELLRAGLMALTALNDAGFKQALAAVPALKTGRPAATAGAATSGKTTEPASAAPAVKRRAVASKKPTPVKAEVAAVVAPKAPAKKSATKTAA
jgi:hypothetical protein